MFNKKEYVTINTDNLNVRRTAKVGKIESKAIESDSGNFKYGISVNGTSINNPKWETIEVNGKKYTVLVK